MPLRKAQNLLERLKIENVAEEEFRECLDELNEQIGYLSCKANNNYDLTKDLNEIIEVVKELQKEYKQRFKVSPRSRLSPLQKAFRLVKKILLN